MFKLNRHFYLKKMKCIVHMSSYKKNEGKMESIVTINTMKLTKYK